MTKDLTVGNPAKLILLFAVPFVLGNIFQQLYNVADTAVVGQVLGTNTLAAVGSTGSIIYLVNGFVNGLSNGFSIPIGRCFGAKDEKRLHKFCANGFWLCIVVSAVILVLTMLFIKPVLVIVKTPKNIFNEALLYLRVIFAGTPFVFLYGFCSGIIRASGDSKTPLLFLIFSAVLNVLLDLLFVVALGMGVAGAACGTVVSEAACALLGIRALRRRCSMAFPHGNDWRFSPQLCAELCHMGVPMGLECSLMGIGSAVLQASVNTLGSDVVAGFTAGSQVSVLLSSPMGYLGVALAAFASQNIGARKLTRVRDGLRTCIIALAAYSAVSFVLLQLFGAYAMQMFVDASKVSVLETGQRYLFWNSAFFFAWGCVIQLRCTLQGLGYSTAAMLAGVAEMGARIAVAFVLVPRLGVLGACLANPCAWCCALALMCVMYRIVIAHVREKIAREENTDRLFETR